MIAPHTGHTGHVLTYAATVLLIFVGLLLFIRLLLRLDKPGSHKPSSDGGANRAQRRSERRTKKRGNR